MKTPLNVGKIARGLGSERRGKVVAGAAASARRSSWPTSKRASACRQAEGDQPTPVGPSGGGWFRGPADAEEARGHFGL